ncbi:MAG: sulfotransferase [Dinoroseobacter sp.]|nr:sulfotransferase [Dinoroseobacter sp.]
METIQKNILLTNTMRSGSSYLSRVISANSRVSMTFDTLNFFRFGYNRYDPIEDPNNFEQLISDFSYRMNNRFGIEISTSTCMKTAASLGYSYATANSLILRQVYPDASKDVLGDAESLVWTKIPEFLKMYPNGKAIVIARDPRDIVNSFRKITIAPNYDYLIALFNAIDAIDYGTRLSQERPDQVHFLTFENLKTQCEREIRGICDFLEIDFEDQMLNPENYTDHFGNPWDDQKSRSFVEEVDPLAAVGRWRKKIDPVDLCLTEWLAKDQLEKIDLELSGQTFDQSIFDEGVARLTSSSLLREAFYRKAVLGIGTERFPLDPTKPGNWDPQGVANKTAFN